MSLEPKYEQRVRKLMARGLSDAEIIEELVRDVPKRYQGPAAAELRPAIAAVRQAGSRNRGRPRWTEDLIGTRLEEARRLAGSDDPRAVAAKFRGLNRGAGPDDQVGISERQLRRLRGRDRTSRE